MTLMINRTNDKSVFRDVNSCELNKPARFSGESMDDTNDADDFRRRKWGPPLSEKL